MGGIRKLAGLDGAKYVRRITVLENVMNEIADIAMWLERGKLTSR